MVAAGSLLLVIGLNVLLLAMLVVRKPPLNRPVKKLEVSANRCTGNSPTPYRCQQRRGFC
eukprot:1750642-Karenia_brevis.AAC.1